MRRVILYIAMSLDGYIADKNGKVHWLEGDGSDSGNPGTYSSFIKSVDTVVLGYKTYHQIVTELAPDNWPYKGMQSYVLTHSKQINTREIEFTGEDIEVLIQDLKNQEGKDIWICGGASIVNQLINSDLIDLYKITIVPTILGDGIRLFENFDKEKKLTLISTQSYNGMAEIVYQKRKID